MIHKRKKLISWPLLSLKHAPQKTLFRESKDQAMEQEEIFSKYTYDQGFVSKYAGETQQ